MAGKEFEIKLEGGGPWGFRLQGGKDFGTPLTIAKVGRICDRVALFLLRNVSGSLSVELRSVSRFETLKCNSDLVLYNKVSF